MDAPLFLSAVLVIFLAALPGRTTFLMILMAARGQTKYLFLGASAAFLLQSAISVGLGSLLSLVSPLLVHAFAGILFLYFAYEFWKESRVDSHAQPDVNEKTNSIRASFFIIFAAEWGDVSQLAIMSFSANHPEKLTVFAAAVFSLLVLAAVAILFGAQLGRAIRPQRIQKIAALGFGVTGIYLLIGAILAAIR